MASSTPTSPPFTPSLIRAPHLRPISLPLLVMLPLSPPSSPMDAHYSAPCTSSPPFPAVSRRARQSHSWPRPLVNDHRGNADDSLLVYCILAHRAGPHGSTPCHWDVRFSRMPVHLDGSRLSASVRDAPATRPVLRAVQLVFASGSAVDVNGTGECGTLRVEDVFIAIANALYANDSRWLIELGSCTRFVGVSVASPATLAVHFTHSFFAPTA